MTDIDKVKSTFETTYFCQVHKWGKDLTVEEAVELGLLKVSPAAPTKARKGTTKKDKINSKEEH